MKWSKLKLLAEDLLADNLKNRIKYHITSYGPGESYIMTRAWITLDGREIANFSSVEWIKEHYFAADKQSTEQLASNGIFSRDQFYQALEEYIQMSIENALASTDPIVRAIAMFDRRIGIRRLESVDLPVDAPDLVRQCLQIRCEAEGIRK